MWTSCGPAAGPFLKSTTCGSAPPCHPARLVPSTPAGAAIDLQEVAE